MAGDAEYYSDGLTEELIGTLRSVRGLRVVPRTTSFQFKGKSADVRAIGRQLEADAVLDGGVQKEGDRLRIRLSHTRVSDGHTIWSQAYDRKSQDVLTTQQEIARSVLNALFPDSTNRADMPPTGTSNPEAHKLYLKANFSRQRYGEGIGQALELFKGATRLDPSYAQAWAAQALCYQQLAYGYQRYPRDVIPLAMPVLDKALALSPRLALAHTTRGIVSLYYLHDWEAARLDLERAIELDPNDGETHHWMSHYWTSVGRITDAVNESRIALSHDPLNFAIGAHQVWMELQRADYAAAIRAAEPTLRLDPRNGPTNFYLWRAYEESGQLEHAIEVKERLGWNTPPVAALRSALRVSGPAGYWRAIAEELEARRKKRPVHPAAIARAHLRLGDRTRALTWLEKAVEERDAHVVYLKYDPAFRGLRSERRFQEIVRAVGCP
jgi:TolB-like protein